MSGKFLSPNEQNCQQTSANVTTLKRFLEIESVFYIDSLFDFHQLEGTCGTSAPLPMTPYPSATPVILRATEVHRRALLCLVFYPSVSAFLQHIPRRRLSLPGFFPRRRLSLPGFRMLCEML